MGRPPRFYEIAEEALSRQTPQPGQTPAGGCPDRRQDMAKVVVPTVFGFAALMGVWVVFGALHMAMM